MVCSRCLHVPQKDRGPQWQVALTGISKAKEHVSVHCTGRRPEEYIIHSGHSGQLQAPSLQGPTYCPQASVAPTVVPPSSAQPHSPPGTPGGQESYGVNTQTPGVMTIGT